MDVVVDGRRINLGAWDYTPRGDSDRLRHLAYPQTAIFFLQYDISRPKTLQSIVDKFYPEVHHHCPSTPFFLVGNKVIRPSFHSPLTIILPSP